MNPWLSISRDSSPYIAEIDREEMATYLAKSKSLKSEFRPQLHIAPEPWCGPILSARVIILSGNPHWDNRDEMFAEQVEDLMWSNLSGDFPLYLLEESLMGTTGATWYRDRLLKDVLDHCDARTIAENLCLVDFVGYRSHKWDHSLRMPSQQFTAQCIRDALRRDAVIIVTRGYKKWLELVPELATYPRSYRNNSWQSVRLSRGNTGDKEFSEIVSTLI